MAEGSELSSLPARLSACTAMLAHFTLRNASSNVFPAGLHSSAQSSAAHTHADVIYTTLFFKEERCLPDASYL